MIGIKAGRWLIFSGGGNMSCWSKEYGAHPLSAQSTVTAVGSTVSPYPCPTRSLAARRSELVLVPDTTLIDQSSPSEIASAISAKAQARSPLPSSR